MKTILLVLLVLGSTWTCSFSSEPLPIDTWTNGCAELAPFQGGYRLQTECCSYVLLPTITMHNGSFSQAGTYYSFTGAGSAGSPMQVSGELSPDATSLTVSYQAFSHAVTRTLLAGTQAAVACQCGCD